MLFLLWVAVRAQVPLAVTVSPVKVTGQKVVVPPALKNNFGEKIESARAVCFLADAQGQVAGQSTQWVIGGGRDKPVLAAGATNRFYFVVSLTRNPSSEFAEFASTNLTAKVTFSRVVLEGGKLADVT